MLQTSLQIRKLNKKGLVSIFFWDCLLREKEPMCSQKSGVRFFANGH